MSDKKELECGKSFLVRSFLAIIISTTVKRGSCEERYH